MNTQTGKIPNNVGFSKTEGRIRKSTIINHIPTDEGKTFKDGFGRSYIYTSKGLIY